MPAQIRCPIVNTLPSATVLPPFFDLCDVSRNPSIHPTSHNSNKNCPTKPNEDREKGASDKTLSGLFMPARFRQPQRHSPKPTVAMNAWISRVAAPLNLSQQRRQTRWAPINNKILDFLLWDAHFSLWGCVKPALVPRRRQDARFTHPLRVKFAMLIVLT